MRFEPILLPLESICSYPLPPPAKPSPHYSFLRPFRFHSFFCSTSFFCDFTSGLYLSASPSFLSTRSLIHCTGHTRSEFSLNFFFPCFPSPPIFFRFFREASLFSIFSSFKGAAPCVLLTFPPFCSCYFFF